MSLAGQFGDSIPLPTAPQPSGSNHGASFKSLIFHMFFIRKIYNIRKKYCIIQTVLSKHLRDNQNVLAYDRCLLNADTF